MGSRDPMVTQLVAPFSLASQESKWKAIQLQHLLSIKVVFVWPVFGASMIVRRTVNLLGFRVPSH